MTERWRPIRDYVKVHNGTSGGHDPNINKGGSLVGSLSVNAGQMFGAMRNRDGDRAPIVWAHHGNTMASDAPHTTLDGHAGSQVARHPSSVFATADALSKVPSDLANDRYRALSNIFTPLVLKRDAPVFTMPAASPEANNNTATSAMLPEPHATASQRTIAVLPPHEGPTPAPPSLASGQLSGLQLLSLSALGLAAASAIA